MHDVDAAIKRFGHGALSFKRSNGEAAAKAPRCHAEEPLEGPHECFLGIETAIERELDELKVGLLGEMPGRSHEAPRAHLRHDAPAHAGAEQAREVVRRQTRPRGDQVQGQGLVELLFDPEQDLVEGIEAGRGAVGRTSRAIG